MRNDGKMPLNLPLERVLEDHNFNVRIFFGDIDQLAVQLMTEGQLEPIKVRQEGDQYFVVDGHRRRRAFLRCCDLRIERNADRFVVFEGSRAVRQAPGPAHSGFDRSRIACTVVDAPEEELFASQLAYNCGKPLTLLERMLFISRLGRSGSYSREQIALKTGFSRTHVANAQHLNAADPRLLECVREGRISQKLALRLLRTFSTEQQLEKVCAARARAEAHNRDKILPKDFDWGEGRERERREPAGRLSADPVRGRLRQIVSRLAEAIRFSPNEVARSRLETLVQINRYVLGEESSDKLESFLLGRE